MQGWRSLHKKLKKHGPRRSNLLARRRDILAAAGVPRGLGSSSALSSVDQDQDV